MNKDYIFKSYVNKYVKNYRDLTGSQMYGIHESVMNKLNNINFNGLNDNIISKILDISWNRKPNNYRLGAWGYYEGSIEILEIWNKNNIYNDISEMYNTKDLYNFNEMIRDGDNIIIPFNDINNAKICLTITK
uniref:Uncharacterized protein n=1 Tax=Pithovirus LCPAC102 TaxID=2506587 RepID=A0A481Z334_9VIRU|nr:MAG: hypothetical protein LCPAC102_00660 [Pithovirus LCPAC102]